MWTYDDCQQVAGTIAAGERAHQVEVNVTEAEAGDGDGLQRGGILACYFAPLAVLAVTRQQYLWTCLSTASGK